MSTLFRRLAAQSQGLAPCRVRPMAALPYQALPAFAEAGSDAAPTNASTAGAPTTMSYTRPADLAAPSPASPDRPVTPDPTAVPQPIATTRRAPERILHTAPPEAPYAATPGELAAPATPADTSAEWPTPSPLVATQDSAPTRAQAIAGTNDVPSPAVSASESRRAGNAVDPASARRDTGPAPLLPRRQARTRPSPPSTPNRQAAEPPAEPNEVHVHIGRIEVTAVQEAAAPKARPKRGQAPMSLDDYLARRRRGGT
ncbi:hypothetical protein G3580_08175 [Nitrogeniibacter mangrovi]|uniref:Uncharacterized protein n=1 Tax=Nitrogeniibacter mangrovi TaxID=2016596 RepID=A0A6C1B1W9_9RHOO|nr:hypothetical protein [Nitrogeniibacter mangrovi]QID17622.1 hypothetical protein G3580_08175 [Nitrogeniibacter mangrovi]